MVELMKLKEAVDLGQDINRVYVVLKDTEEPKQLAAGRSIHLTKDGYIVVYTWFGQNGAEAIKEDRKFSLIIWDHHNDFGYELIGRVENVSDLQILDGTLPEAIGQLMIWVEELRELHCVDTQRV